MRFLDELILCISSRIAKVDRGHIVYMQTNSHITDRKGVKDAKLLQVRGVRKPTHCYNHNA